MQKGVFPLKIKIRQICQSKFVQNQNLFIFHSVRIHFHYFWSSTLCWRYDVDTPKFGIVTWESKLCKTRSKDSVGKSKTSKILHNWDQNREKFSIFIYYDNGQGHFQVIDRLAWNYYVHIMSLFSWKPYR